MHRRIALHNDRPLGHFFHLVQQLRIVGLQFLGNVRMHVQHDIFMLQVLGDLAHLDVDFVKSVTTICNEIYVEMSKIAKHLEHEDVMLRVHPDVAKELTTNNAKLLNEMDDMTKRTIIVKSDPAVHQEQFDIN